MQLVSKLLGSELQLGVGKEHDLLALHGHQVYVRMGNFKPSTAWPTFTMGNARLMACDFKIKLALWHYTII